MSDEQNDKHLSSQEMVITLVADYKEGGAPEIKRPADDRSRKPTKKDINLKDTAAALQTHLAQGIFSEEDRPGVEDFYEKINSGDQKPVDPLADTTPAEIRPAIAGITGSGKPIGSVKRAILPERTMPVFNPALAATLPANQNIPRSTASRTDRTSSSVPAAECSPRQQKTHWWPGIVIGATLGILCIASVITLVRPKHLPTNQPMKKAAATTPNSFVPKTAQKPVPVTMATPISTASPAEPKPNTPSVILYRYKVSRKDVLNGDNTVSWLAARFNCDALKLRDYNKSLFSSPTNENLGRGQLVWIPSDECNYQGVEHLHTDATLSYTVTSEESPLVLVDLARRFECNERKLRHYLAETSPDLNLNALPVGSRIYLPDSYCKAVGH